LINAGSETARAIQEVRAVDATFDILDFQEDVHVFLVSLE